MLRRVVAFFCLVAPLPVYAQSLALPLKAQSVRFAVIGDPGTGGREQFEIAQRMVEYRQRFLFDFVMMLGDNIYGRDRQRDFEKKFLRPYDGLLKSGVKFYAALGNHDQPKQCFFEPFHMGGKRYYSFKQGNVFFLVLDSTAMTSEQLRWTETELRNSHTEWKIATFHHPLYSSGAKHGPATGLRTQLEPLFVKYGIRVVFSGHEHFYERLRPQKGIYYFISGAAGKLRKGNITQTGLTEVGFDQDLSFMLVEVADEVLFFETVSRTGVTVDSGRIALSKSN